MRGRKCCLLLQLVRARWTIKPCKPFLFLFRFFGCPLLPLNVCSSLTLLCFFSSLSLTINQNIKPVWHDSVLKDGNVALLYPLLFYAPPQPQSTSLLAVISLILRALGCCACMGNECDSWWQVNTFKYVWLSSYFFLDFLSPFLSVLPLKSPGRAILFVPWRSPAASRCSGFCFRLYPVNAPTLESRLCFFRFCFAMSFKCSLQRLVRT